jgi:peptidoglycan-associated lipoprotein
MNTISRFFLAMILLCTVSLLTACGPKPVSPYPGGANASDMNGNQMGNITEETAPGTEGLNSTGRGAGSLSGNADQQTDAYKREHGRCSPEFKPVYFDYDQSKIKSDQIPNMEHNGNYLKQNHSAKVLIEGNTDNRGTNEYNLALGERRAMSAKNYLRAFGIEEGRIRTISYGKERPLFNGTNDDDFAHNRRDDFIRE